MTFIDRQQELVRHLQWGPKRGARRRALLGELRDLVTAELRREVNRRAPEEEAPPAAPYHRPARPFYWLEHDGDEARP